ncbi:MAG: copper-translocating P-type ATPase [Candidatus Tyloplasma litorale]|nr:MAG: copper-translocating P-type ATPase [Mycoplasmatales bacterium]
MNLKVIWKKILNHLGLYSEDGKYKPKKWILVYTTIFGALSIYYMIFSLFIKIDEWRNPILYIMSNDWLQFVISTLAFILVGFAFIKSSMVQLMKKEIGEDMLVAMATSASYFYSLIAFIINLSTNNDLPYFFYESLEILWLIYLGRFIEEWLTNKVTNDMNSLESLKPKKAIKLVDGKEIEVEISNVKINDFLIVKPGSIVPADGKIVEGETTIDESTLTGESMPIHKIIGSRVFSGTVSSNGLIVVQVEKEVDDSFISKIINSINEATNAKPDSQKIADKIAKWLVPSVLVIAIITFITTGLVYSLTSFNIPVHTYLNEPWLYSFYVFITVLVIACPCSFILITPMSVLISSFASKKESVLLTSKNIFETIKKIDTICFDKTGTLTKGKFKVVSSTIPSSMIELFVSAEKNSNHPLAKSITKHFSNIEIFKIRTKEIIGKGILIEEKKLMIGSYKWLKEINNSFIENENVVNLRKDGSVIIYLFDSKKVYGYIELKDEIKETALMALSQMRRMGIDIMMITGDNKETALNIGSKLGISSKDIFYEIDPNKKSNIIDELRKKGKKIAFVGDGINDTIALANSDLGIAINTSMDAAIDVADVVLNSSDLTLVSYAIWLSRKTLSTINRGFLIAIFYNIIFVSLAATGIIGMSGIGPALSAMSMTFNDTVAMINASTLFLDNKNKFERKNNN